MILPIFFSVFVILAAISASVSVSFAQDKALSVNFDDELMFDFIRNKKLFEKEKFPIGFNYNLKFYSSVHESQRLTVGNVLDKLIFGDFEGDKFNKTEYEYEFSPKFGNHNGASSPQKSRIALSWQDTGVSDITPALRASGINPAGDMVMALENFVEIGSDGEVYWRSTSEPVRIFVGVGYSESPHSMISVSNESNYPGSRNELQDIFLLSRFHVDAVANSVQAAELVVNYRNIVSRKFNEDNDQMLADHLLNSARRDTIYGYSPSLHGKGEVSLHRALAPFSIK